MFGMGANFAARRRLFTRVGEFDVILGGGGPLKSSQDYDLAYRTYRAGSVILLRPEVTLRHDGRREAEDWPALLTAYGIGDGAFYSKHVRCRDPYALWLLTRRLVDAFARVIVRAVRAPPARRRPVRAGHARRHPRQFQVRCRPPDPAVPREIERRPMTGQITILGAGPTGLGTAYRLAEMGHDQWDIYERADHVGGLASSYTDEHGFIWDHGGHVMFSHYTYFDDLVEKMLRGDYDQHMREAWVWMCGRFVPYPFQNNIHRLPPDVFLECVMGIIESQKTTLPREHFAQWINAIFGDGIARHFMLPYNFKVWAHPLEMMSTSWQGDRVPDVERGTDPAEPARRPRRRVVGAEQHVQVPAARHRDAVRPDGGGTAEGGQPRTFGGRHRRRRQGGHVRRRSTAGYDKLVTTMPLKELVKCIPDCPPEVIAAVGDLHHTSGMFVGIGVAEPCDSTKCWMYFPESNSPFYRVTYLSNYSPQVTPGPDHFSLLAEVSASPYKHENADDVIERTIEGMVASELLTPEQAADKIVSKQLLQVPVLVPGADDRSRPCPGGDPALADVARHLLARPVRRVALRDRQHRPLGHDGRRARRPPRQRPRGDHLGAAPRRGGACHDLVSASRRSALAWAAVVTLASTACGSDSPETLTRRARQQHQQRRTDPTSNRRPSRRAPNRAPPCGASVRLHGKGGTGGETHETDGITEVLPTGNADGWGARQWIYFPDESYVEARDIVAAAAADAGCTTLVINGFSNGAAFAAKLYCRGETFDGRFAGVVIDDPVPDNGVAGCTPSAGVPAALYWTGGLEAEARPDADCGAIDWTCDGGTTIGIEAYAESLGLDIQPSPFTEHEWYLDAPEIATWLGD